MLEEINNIGHNRFYISGIMMNNGPLKYDCGNSLKDFDELKLLKITKILIIIIFKVQHGLLT